MGHRPIATAKLSLLKAAAAKLCSTACLAALCFLLLPTVGSAQAPFGADQYAAKAIQVTGNVSVLREGVEYAVMEGGEVRVKELIFTGADGSARFLVSDGSTFDVFPNSRVVFRKNVPNWRDLLDVLVGRVKVHIQHLGTQPNPNRVVTPTAVISVRGTTFDISVDEDDETTLVEVEEGVVEVQHALLPRGNPKVLNAGESVHVYRNEPIASNGFDKGEFVKRSVRMVVDALSTWESRIPRGVAGVGSSGGGNGSGDTGKKPPPPTSPGTPGTPPSSGGFTSGSTVYVNGHTYGMSQTPETRWHKVGHAVVHMLSRLMFGTPPEDEIIRAIGHRPPD
jgi:FecR-like protein